MGNEADDRRTTPSPACPTACTRWTGACGDTSPGRATLGGAALTDPAAVFLSIRARTAPVAVEAIEAALYEDRELLRMLGMRRTMFVVADEIAPVIQASCTDAIAVSQRMRYTQILTKAGVGDAAWLRELEEATLGILDATGEATGAQLSAAEPRLRTPITVAEGKTYEATQNVTTWVLFLLAAEGRIVRGRPRGTWASSQYHWSPVRRWLPAGMLAMPAPQAREELVRRWLHAYGPATVGDIKWWTGWTAGHVKQALTAIAPEEVDLGGTTGLVLAGDTATTKTPPPWIAVLPALDPTPMGWQERSWYLGPHAKALFDRSGNIGPTIWCDGRIVGGWAQRSDGSVAYRLLEDIGTEATDAVQKETTRVSTWIGPVRVTPRFRTPLERELSA